jgi:hypothetical protein
MKTYDQINCDSKNDDLEASPDFSLAWNRCEDDFDNLSAQEFESYVSDYETLHCLMECARDFVLKTGDKKEIAQHKMTKIVEDLRQTYCEKNVASKLEEIETGGQWA